jgi:hypothetical protein
MCRQVQEIILIINYHMIQLRCTVHTDQVSARVSSVNSRQESLRACRPEHCPTSDIDDHTVCISSVHCVHFVHRVLVTNQESFSKKGALSVQCVHDVHWKDVVFKHIFPLDRRMSQLYLGRREKQPDTGDSERLLII